MIPLKVRIFKNGTETLGVGRFGRRGFNAIVRSALEKVAQWWADNRLNLKFEPGAKQYYRFAPRSRKYEQKKRRLLDQGIMPVRIGNRFAYVRSRGAMPPFSQDLVFTGDMRRRLLGQSYKPAATATSTRMRVKVPIPLGHPVQLRTAAEVGQLHREELAMMHKMAHDLVVAEIGKQGVAETMGGAA